MQFKKSDIIKALQENKASYLEVYQKLFEIQKARALALADKMYKDQIKQAKSYREKTIEQIEAIRPGETNVKFNAHPPIPNNQENIYSNAISMFESAYGDIVELDFAGYLNYVKDQWGWRVNLNNEILAAENAAYRENEGVEEVESAESEES